MSTTHEFAVRISQATDPLPVSDPEEFDYRSIDPIFLIRDLQRLPLQLWKVAVYLLRSGYSSRFVTTFLLAHGYRGGVQHLKAQDLLFRVECLRRGVKSFAARTQFANPYTYPCTQSKSGSSHNVEAAGKAEENAARLTLLLWWIAHLPEPRSQEFLRILMEGGEVERQALRLATQLKSGTSLSPRELTNSGAGPVRRISGRQERGVSKYRALKGPGMLLSLSELPLPVLQHAIFLLLNRVPALVVARFIRCHENLGSSPRSENSLRQYLSFLRTLVLQEARPSPLRKRLLHQVAKNIQEQQVRHKLTVTARRLSAIASDDPRARLTIPEVQSLPAIKTELLALFALDPKPLLAQINLLKTRGNRCAG